MVDLHRTSQLNPPNPEEEDVWRVKDSFSGLNPLPPPSLTPFTIMERVPQRDSDGKAEGEGLTAWSLFVSLEKPAALLSD